MRYWIFAAIVVISGCVARPPATPQTQLQIREFQTRSYGTSDVKMVMKAMLNVLQDEGYIVKNANVELGLLTATKEINVYSFGEALVMSLISKQNARWKKTSIVECSANVSAFGEKTRVRINFQVKTLNNRGEVMDVKQIIDLQHYQTFFSKVDKGIFIEQEQL